MSPFGVLSTSISWKSSFCGSLSLSVVGRSLVVRPYLVRSCSPFTRPPTSLRSVSPCHLRFHYRYTRYPSITVECTCRPFPAADVGRSLTVVTPHSTLTPAFRRPRRLRRRRSRPNANAAGQVCCWRLFFLCTWFRFCHLRFLVGLLSLRSVCARWSFYYLRCDCPVVLEFI